MRTVASATCPTCRARALVNSMICDRQTRRVIVGYSRLNPYGFATHFALGALAVARSFDVTVRNALRRCACAQFLRNRHLLLAEPRD